MTLSFPAKEARVLDAQCLGAKCEPLPSGKAFMANITVEEGCSVASTPH